MYIKFPLLNLFNMKRLFVGIDLADNQHINKLILDFSRRLHKNKIRWVRPENLHLTLQFLGPTPKEKLLSVEQNITQAVENTQAFTLSFERLGIFGSSYKPRIIWLGFSPNPHLIGLAERLKLGMIEYGFREDRQNFVPHITLGRIGKIESKKYFQAVWEHFEDWSMPDIEVKEIKLLESVLHKDGPEYQSLGVFDLRG
jgi:2'-5' RNA ligase